MTDKTWLGGSTSFSSPGNWNPGGEPQKGDIAVFGSSAANKIVDISGLFIPALAEWLFNGGDYTVNVLASVDLTGTGVEVMPGGTALINIGSADNVVFQNASSAGSATYVALGSRSSVQFEGHSDGGTASFVTVGSGSFVDFSGSSGPNGDNKISAGSIAGAGNFILGLDQLLTVGSNKLDAVVTGHIFGGAGSSLTKVGAGTLTLSGTDTFSGTLTLQGGTVDLAGATADSASLTVFGAGARETLRIENAALPGNHFTPSIAGFAFGDAIDLPGLPFKAGATTSYNSSLHTLAVNMTVGALP